MEESILKLQLLEKKDLAEPEIDIRYSSMTQPLNRIVQYIRQQEYLIQGIFEKKLYQIPLNEVLYFETVDKKTFMYTQQKIFECTLNVQISKEQQLITNGMYKFVRHPAYTGSILSLLGVSIALKNIPAILIVAICSFVCYQIRINVEEAVLQKYFKEYNLYKEKTYKLFPYIY